MTDAICATDGCPEPVRCRSLCARHYDAKLRLDRGMKPQTGRRSHPLYNTWAAIVDRTGNPDNACFAHYGGRGIALHPEWRADPDAFLRWIDETLGARPSGCSLDRIDNDGDYAPGNLRWATRREQARNSRPALRSEAGVYLRPSGRWQAKIPGNRYLGTFATKGEALAARHEALGQ